MKIITLLFIVFLTFISCKDSSVNENINLNKEIELEKHDSLFSEIIEEKEILISDSIVSSEVDNPFLKMKFDKVIAYDYDGSSGTESQFIIDKKGLLNSTIIRQKELTQNQIKTLIYFIGHESTYGNTKASCFEPHLGIVFYQNNKVVSYLSICLDCNYLISSINIPATGFKKIKVGDDFEYDAEGFSKIGRQKINTLCKSLKFSHCEEKLESMFD